MLLLEHNKVNLFLSTNIFLHIVNNIFMSTNHLTKAHLTKHTHRKDGSINITILMIFIRTLL